jgi:hypothetical protein
MERNPGSSRPLPAFKKKLSIGQFFMHLLGLGHAPLRIPFAPHWSTNPERYGGSWVCNLQFQSAVPQVRWLWQSWMDDTKALAWYSSTRLTSMCDSCLGQDWLPGKGRTRPWGAKSLLIEFLGCIQIVACTHVKAPSIQALGVRSNRWYPQSHPHLWLL